MSVKDENNNKVLVYFFLLIFLTVFGFFIKILNELIWDSLINWLRLYYWEINEKLNDLIYQVTKKKMNWYCKNGLEDNFFKKPVILNDENGEITLCCSKMKSEESGLINFLNLTDGTDSFESLKLKNGKSIINYYDYDNDKFIKERIEIFSFNVNDFFGVGHSENESNETFIEILQDFSERTYFFYWISFLDLILFTFLVTQTLYLPLVLFGLIPQGALRNIKNTIKNKKAHAKFSLDSLLEKNINNQMVILRMNGKLIKMCSKSNLDEYEGLKNDAEVKYHGDEGYCFFNVCSSNNFDKVMLNGILDNTAMPRQFFEGLEGNGKFINFQNCSIPGWYFMNILRIEQKEIDSDSIILLEFDRIPGEETEPCNPRGKREVVFPISLKGLMEVSHVGFETQADRNDKTKKYLNIEQAKTLILSRHFGKKDRTLNDILKSGFINESESNLIRVFLNLNQEMIPKCDFKEKYLVAVERSKNDIIRINLEITYDIFEEIKNKKAYHDKILLQWETFSKKCLTITNKSNEVLKIKTVKEVAKKKRMFLYGLFSCFRKSLNRKHKEREILKTIKEKSMKFIFLKKFFYDYRQINLNKKRMADQIKKEKEIEFSFLENDMRFDSLLRTIHNKKMRLLRKNKMVRRPSIQYFDSFTNDLVGILKKLKKKKIKKTKQNKRRSEKKRAVRKQNKKRSEEEVLLKKHVRKKSLFLGGMHGILEAGEICLLKCKPEGLSITKDCIDKMKDNPTKKESGQSCQIFNTLSHRESQKFVEKNLSHFRIKPILSNEMP